MIDFPTGHQPQRKSIRFDLDCLSLCERTSDEPNLFFIYFCLSIQMVRARNLNINRSRGRTSRTLLEQWPQSLGVRRSPSKNWYPAIGTLTQRLLFNFEREVFFCCCSLTCFFLFVQQSIELTGWSPTQRPHLTWDWRQRCAPLRFKINNKHA